MLWWRHIDTYDHPAEFLFQGSIDGASWATLRDTRGAATNRTHDYLVLDEPAPYRYIRLTGFIQAYGGAFAVSGLRVFGLGSGEPPATNTRASMSPSSNPH